MQSSCAWVLFLQLAAALRQLPLDAGPVIVGSLSLEPGEVAGQAPVFVDAFLDVDGLRATVILSYSPMYSSNKVAGSEQEKWRNAHWVCSWYSPYHDFSSVQWGVMLHDTWQASLPGELNASEVTLRMGWIHHSMVVGCPLPSGSHSVASMRLDVTASRDNIKLYARTGITVQSTSFVKPGADLVLCTMVDGIHNTGLLWPWAKYHIVGGFQQILIYVESPSTKSTEKLLHDLVQSGHVTLVPFYFGNLSEGHQFYMQAAMEQHCLFQARGRAVWLGHNDIDEFFELRPNWGLRSSLRDFLMTLPPDTAAVEVRSQMWQEVEAPFWEPLPHPLYQALVPFPCGITCKGPGYFGKDVRTKWIARPTMVQLRDPHHVFSNFTILSPDPDNTLRLNHFRHCQPGRCQPYKRECVEDTSFSVYCTAAMKAELPVPLAQ